jgi:O-antigen/teichoic acid export membrane protein
MVILARLVTPAETGLFSVAASVVLLARAIRDFGVSEFLIQERNLTPQKIRTAFGMTLMLAWSLGALLFFGRGMIAAAYGTPGLANLVAIACGSFLVAPFSSTNLALLNRELAFGVLLRISLASNLTNAVVSIFLARWGWGAMALTIGLLATSVTTAGAAIFAVPTKDHFIPSLREWRALASFGAYISGANIINQITERLPDLIIGRLLGYQMLGLYNRGNGIVATFHEMILSGTQTVAFPAFAEAHRNGENVRQPYLRAVALITGAGFPVLASIAIVAEPVVKCLLGPNWISAVPLIPPLAVYYGMTMIAPMVSIYLSATGWVRMIPRIAVGLQISFLAIISVTANFNIVWVAYGNIAYGALNLAINSHYLRKATGIRFTDLLRAITKSGTVTIFAAVPAFAVTELPTLAGKPLLVLLTALSAGGIALCVSAIMLRHPIVTELRLMLRETRRPAHRVYQDGI